MSIKSRVIRLEGFRGNPESGTSATDQRLAYWLDQFHSDEEPYGGHIVFVDPGQTEAQAIAHYCDTQEISREEFDNGNYTIIDLYDPKGVRFTEHEPEAKT